MSAAVFLFLTLSISVKSFISFERGNHVFLMRAETVLSVNAI